MKCKQSEKDIAGDEWNLGKLIRLSEEEFWTWGKTDTTGYDRHDYLALGKCVDFERELWFELGECIWRKHRSVYQDHMKYVRKYIVELFKVKIIRYAERMREMYYLYKYLPPPSIKGKSAEADNWTIHNQEFTDGKF